MKLDAIIEKITSEFSLEPSAVIEAETELLMSGLVDSLGVVSLLAWLESEMGASIDPGLVTLENFERPNAIYGLCQEVLAAS